MSFSSSTVSAIGQYMGFESFDTYAHVWPSLPLYFESWLPHRRDHQCFSADRTTKLEYVRLIYPVPLLINKIRIYFVMTMWTIHSHHLFRFHSNTHNPGKSGPCPHIQAYHPRGAHKTSSNRMDHYATDTCNGSQDFCSVKTYSNRTSALDFKEHMLHHTLSQHHTGLHGRVLAWTVASAG